MGHCIQIAPETSSRHCRRNILATMALTGAAAWHQHRERQSMDETGSEPGEAMRPWLFDLACAVSGHLNGPDPSVE